MKTIAALDPASMRVQLELSYYVRTLDKYKDRKFIDCIIQSDTVGMSNEFAKITDPAVRARAGFLSLTYWHEQRHFLDFFLTNWGASWNRLYLRWIDFLPSLLSTLQKDQLPLPVPLDRVLCPVSLKSMGIQKNYPNHIAEFALNIERQLESMCDDRHAIVKLGPELEIGGRSQLECLAVIAQAAMSSEWLGNDLISEINKVGHKVSASSQHASKIVTYMHQRGIVECKIVDGRMTIWKPTLPAAILTAALCCRRSPLPDTSDLLQVSAYYPFERLVLIVDALKNAGRNLNSAPAEQVWSEVQRVCRSLWDRTPEEEIEADINWMHDNLSALISTRVKAGQTDPITNHFVEIMRDIINLRRLVLQRFKNNVASFIEPRSYARHLGPDLKPRVLACAPHGYLDLDPGRFKPVHLTAEDRSDSRWWSAVSTKWEAQGKIALPDTEAWHVASRDYGPVANFLMRGHFHADTGVNRPDRALAHLALQNQSMLDVRVYNNFRRPRIDRSAERYFNAFGDSIKCDICGKKLLKDEAVALTRYDILLSDDLKIIRERYLDRFPWDWSDWLVHSSHLNES